MDAKDREALRLIMRAFISLLNVGDLNVKEAKRLHRAYRIVVLTLND